VWFSGSGIALIVAFEWLFLRPGRRTPEG